LEFYAAGLDQIVELNRQAVPMVEIYASIIAKKMLTNSDPGLRRPDLTGRHWDRRACSTTTTANIYGERRGPDAG